MTGKIRYALLAAAAIALALVLSLFAGVFHPKIPGSAKDVGERIDGTVVTAALESRAGFEEVAGTVQASSDTILASRIMATVLRVNVHAGDSVEAGQVLIELDDEALLAVHAQRIQEAAAAQALLEESQLHQARTQSLRQQGSVSAAAMDQAVTATRRAAADLERAQRAVAEAGAAMSYARIRAPMSGTVVERYAEAGDMASPGAPLVKLFNPGQLRVEATVRESLIQHVGLGRELAAEIDALEKNLTAVVEEIVPAADPTSRTFVLKARLADTNGLFPGMFARLSIPVAQTPGIWVPIGAVQSAGQLNFVYVRDEGTDLRRFVRLGKTDGDLVEVRSGLSSGEEIVLPAGF